MDQFVERVLQGGEGVTPQETAVLPQVLEMLLREKPTVEKLKRIMNTNFIDKDFRMEIGYEKDKEAEKTENKKSAIIKVPGTRINGIDKYAVMDTAQNIMKELEKAGWADGEAKLLPEYMQISIEKNQKQRADATPFLVPGINQ